MMKLLSGTSIPSLPTEVATNRLISPFLYFFKVSVFSSSSIPIKIKTFSISFVKEGKLLAINWNRWRKIGIPSLLSLDLLPVNGPALYLIISNSSVMYFARAKAVALVSTKIMPLTSSPRSVRSSTRISLKVFRWSLVTPLNNSNCWQTSDKKNTSLMIPVYWFWGQLCN